MIKGEPTHLCMQCTLHLTLKGHQQVMIQACLGLPFTHFANLIPVESGAQKSPNKSRNWSTPWGLTISKLVPPLGFDDPSSLMPRAAQDRFDCSSRLREAGAPLWNAPLRQFRSRRTSIERTSPAVPKPAHLSGSSETTSVEIGGTLYL